MLLPATWGAVLSSDFLQLLIGTRHVNSRFKPLSMRLIGLFDIAVTVAPLEGNYVWFFFTVKTAQIRQILVLKYDQLTIRTNQQYAVCATI